MKTILTYVLFVLAGLALVGLTAVSQCARKQAIERMVGHEVSWSDIWLSSER